MGKDTRNNVENIVGKGLGRSDMNSMSNSIGKDHVVLIQ